MKSFSLLEYRIWQYNQTTNLFIYNQLLSNKHKKRSFHPLVSLIIPVYNGSNYLEEAIQSALNQTYDNIEIVVVNDGSQDGGKSEKIAKKFGKNIVYLKKKNGGVSSALNYGISKMSGDYFAWLSHDDLIDNNHIEKLVEWLSYEGTDYDIPFSSFKLIDENGDILFNETIKAQLFCNDLKISFYYNDLSLLQGEINGGSVLIPKDAFNKCGDFNESQKITQERDLWDRLIDKGYHFINLPFDTASIRRHDSQVTNTNNIINETNSKSLDIIKNLSKKRKTVFGSDLVLLENLKRSYGDNGKDYLYNEVSKIINDIKES